MDGIANVARQQQSQVGTEMQEKVALQSQQVAQIQPTKENAIKEIQVDSTKVSKQINTKEDVQNLVKKLNTAIQPMNTNIKFGVDSQNVFFVSVTESQTNKIIRRFPAEQAQDLLPKMQEVTGILFDSRG